MNHQELRIRLRIKRDLVSLLGYKPHRFTSINRAEKIPFSRAEKIEPYSNNFSIEVEDPRSNRTLGHHFNPRDVYLLEDVIVEPKQGLIYTENGLLLSESTNWSTSNLYESFPWNPKRVSRHLNSAPLINLTSSAFGHWLVEDLASTLYLIQKYPDSILLVSKFRSRFVNEIIDYLNREIIEVDGPVRVKKLLTVTKQNDSGWMNPRDLEILQEFAKGVGSIGYETPNKIYATRRSLKRSPSNEVDIENLFRSSGFSVLKLEDLDFITEIQIMKNVTELAGISGSWQFNSIWMPTGSKLFDIANENYWTELAHRVCHLKKIRYNWAVYKGKFESAVDLQKLAKDLEASNL